MPDWPNTYPPVPLLKSTTSKKAAGLSHTLHGTAPASALARSRRGSSER